MADAGRSELPRRAAVGVVGTWRRLNFEQRVAGIGALLLVVSTFGPFSFVEAATLLTALAVLVLLRKRAEGREFHIPFGDGSVIAAAGAWSALLIVLRLPARPPGQTLLALVCAALLLVAGVAERRKRPPDDLPGPTPEAYQRGPEAVEWEEPTERLRRPARRSRDEATDPLGEPQPRVGGSDAPTRANRRPRRPKKAVNEGGSEAPREPTEADAQLELTPEPPANEPLPPPEFQLPGEDDEPPLKD
jgi:hypothetical protein